MLVSRVTLIHVSRIVTTGGNGSRSPMVRAASHSVVSSVSTSLAAFSAVSLIAYSRMRAPRALIHLLLEILSTRDWLVTSSGDGKVMFFSFLEKFSLDFPDDEMLPFHCILC